MTKQEIARTGINRKCLCPACIRARPERAQYLIEAKKIAQRSYYLKPDDDDDDEKADQVAAE